MTTQLNALQLAVNFIGDAIVDTEHALADNSGSGMAKLVAYENLIPDLMALVPLIGDIPNEAKALQPQDYITLVNGLVQRLAITNAKAEAVVTAAVKLLSDVVMTIVPDVQALVAALKQ